MKKRGYFFTLDVLLALIVIVVGFMMIWSSIASRPSIAQPYFLSHDLLAFMSAITIADVSSDDYVMQLVIDRNITNMDYTILEQIAVFYHENDTSARPNDHVLMNFTRALLANATPYQYSFEFRFDNKSLYFQQNPVNKPQDESDSLVSVKGIVIAAIGKSDITPPYAAEVRVWQ